MDTYVIVSQIKCYENLTRFSLCLPSDRVESASESSDTFEEPLLT